MSRLTRGSRMLLVLWLIGMGVGTLAEDWTWDLPPGFPAPTVPADNPITREKVELGRLLFFDKRLSGNGTQSCATCHRPERAFTDGLAQALGSTGEQHPRSAMSLANVAYNSTLTWQDPQLTRLEEQALVPMFNVQPVELGLRGHQASMLTRLRGDLVYPTLFRSAFPASNDSPTVEQIAQALASFERTLIAGDAPYFRWIYRDDRAAVSAAAQRGARLFFSDRTRCSTCHEGFTFSGPVYADGLERGEPVFHNTGLYSVDAQGSYPADSPGAIQHSGREEHRGAFRAPTLLNIDHTAPYMHDGTIATLADVIDFYAAGGRGDGRNNPNKSERIHGFELSAEEKADMIEFLQSLTDRSFLEDPRFADPFAERQDGMRSTQPQ